jgi:hypothetical protein
MTADGCTLQNSAILRRSASGIGRSARHSRTSGWMPIERSSLTECWVGLVLSSPADGNERQQRQVDIEARAPAEVLPELPDGLEERQRLDVAHRAADLGQHEIDVVGAGGDELLDGVGDVRDDLHGGAEIVAAALPVDDVLVDAARGDVVEPARGDPGEALVVPEVEIGLRPVVGDEDLAVLIRAHGPRIDVQVGSSLRSRTL